MRSVNLIEPGQERSSDRIDLYFIFQWTRSVFMMGQAIHDRTTFVILCNANGQPATPVCSIDTLPYTYTYIQGGGGKQRSDCCLVYPTFFFEIRLCFLQSLNKDSTNSFCWRSFLFLSKPFWKIQCKWMTLYRWRNYRTHSIMNTHVKYFRLSLCKRRDSSRWHVVVCFAGAIWFFERRNVYIRTP